MLDEGLLETKFRRLQRIFIHISHTACDVFVLFILAVLFFVALGAILVYTELSSTGIFIVSMLKSFFWAIILIAGISSLLEIYFKFAGMMLRYKRFKKQIISEQIKQKEKEDAATRKGHLARKGR